MRDIVRVVVVVAVVFYWALGAIKGPTPHSSCHSYREFRARIRIVYRISAYYIALRRGSVFSLIHGSDN